MVTTIAGLKHSTKSICTSKNRNSDGCDEISDEAFKNMMNSFFENDIPCGLLKILPEFSHHFIPKEIQIPLPQAMGNIYLKELEGASIQVLIEESKRHFAQYRVTLEQSLSIEKLTKKQRKSKHWQIYRQGRVTASQSMAIFKTNMGDPSRSVVMTCCYPTITSINNAAIKYVMINILVKY